MSGEYRKVPRQLNKITLIKFSFRTLDNLHDNKSNLVMYKILINTLVSAYKSHSY